MKHCKIWSMSLLSAPNKHALAKYSHKPFSYILSKTIITKEEKQQLGTAIKRHEALSWNSHVIATKVDYAISILVMVTMQLRTCLILCFHLVVGL